ncbi:hypothetical protein [Abyssicoccus albus]|uniref:Holliday junction resolvasome RuvABC endonuclease subunit n=1 Tax=Abyssicoccus albus TaxID=1817405 RepID=A0A3N5BBH5_9BACL|nr:hypothetical protein [Abyssicoccus albus]RPF54767.1 Holliday junction resolvasome RuvABC endonuclease subunit [Abyssicoccus albus]
MRVLGLDLSFAKTGYAVFDIDPEDKSYKLIDYGLIQTDSKWSDIERIQWTLSNVSILCVQYRVDKIVKEGAVVGRASTATPVLKTHGAFENFFAKWLPIHDIHNATVKKYARQVVDEKGNGKEIVEKSVVYLFGQLDGLHTKKGRYLDDVGDAILLTLAYSELVDGTILTKKRSDEDE